MSAFKFRLEKVLSVREIMEERAQQTWVSQERRAHEERLKLIELEEQKKEIKAFGYEQSDIKLRQAMYAFLVVLDQRIEAQHIRVHEQESAAVKAKEAWLLTRQETKKVVTLRDQQHALFMKEEERKEQKRLDDMRSHLRK